MPQGARLLMDLDQLSLRHLSILSLKQSFCYNIIRIFLVAIVTVEKLPAPICPGKLSCAATWPGGSTESQTLRGRCPTLRLLTRSDFDGLVCGVLLKEAGIIDNYLFTHPHDIQDGAVNVTQNDVLANIPYSPGCGLWFDHHASEGQTKSLLQYNFTGACRPAKSCARIIYEYYGGGERFGKFDDMMEAVDRTDSGDLTARDIVEPEGWILLSFIMDPRTGLGRYKDYKISNYRLMEDLIDYCRTKSIGEILQIPDVQERIRRYYEQQELYGRMIKENSKVYRNVLVIDLRNVKEIYTGNRFLEYAIFPETSVSIRVMWGLHMQNVIIAVGHSITRRTCRTNIGLTLMKYRGGGHRQVGTCQVEQHEADDVLMDLVRLLIKDEEKAQCQRDN